MRDVIGMLLAGGRVEELSVLTAARTKAAVPFGGQYLIVDFALSCLVQAGIEMVGVLSLYRPYHLIAHLGTGEPWDLVGRGRGVEILPPYLGDGRRRWHRGTADAMYQYIDFIQEHDHKDVLVLSGDHIYHMDFRPLIEQHRRSGADLTMVVKDMDPSIGKGRFGVVQMDDQGCVTEYQEKPERADSRLVSLSMYLFKSEVLVERLEENVRSKQGHQLASEVISSMLGRDRVHAFTHEGYWNYVRTVDAYYQANLDLLGDEPPIRLDRWGIRTRPVLSGLGDAPPVRHASPSVCKNSVVSPGCQIAGEVSGCVLGPGVVVEAGARVTDSILMQDVVVKSGAYLERVVLDRKTEVLAGARLGEGDPAVFNQRHPDALSGGVTLVGARTRIPDGARVGTNCIIPPGLQADQWKTRVVADGMTLSPRGGVR
jgi:glucose-1-phosphate adenylyltransferase